MKKKHVTEQKIIKVKQRITKVTKQFKIKARKLKIIYRLTLM